MLVAALDTATLTLSCALAELDRGGPRLVAEHSEVAPSKGAGGGHSARLPGALVDLLASAGKSLSDVEGYAIGLGPGSFTGLRIGLATWKGLAYANQRPIAGGSSLAAMALAAAPAAPAGALLVPLLDARRGEVYAGFYRRLPSGELEAVALEAALSPEALVSRLAALARSGGGERFGFGEGWAAYREVLEPALPQLAGAPATPPALAVARLAGPTLLGGGFDPSRIFALEPHYVRPSEAEIKFPQGFGVGGKAGT